MPADRRDRRPPRLHAGQEKMAVGHLDAQRAVSPKEAHQKQTKI